MLVHGGARAASAEDEALTHIVATLANVHLQAHLMNETATSAVRSAVLELLLAEECLAGVFGSADVTIGCATSRHRGHRIS